MGTEPRPQEHTAPAIDLTADLTAELERWVKRWSVDPGDLEAFMDEVVVVTQFNAVVQNDGSTVTTDIPAAARADLVQIITRARRGGTGQWGPACG